MDIDTIQRLTQEYGEGWGYPHARRVLRLIEQVGQGMAYDPQVVAFAAYLHDWGAYPRFRRPGVEHALRSRQVVEEEVLPFTGLAAGVVQHILEAIELHDYRDPRRPDSLDALLLREADCLDFLGVIGILREFAWGPNDLNACYQRVLSRVEVIRGRLTLPAAQAIAAERLIEMESFLQRLLEEGFGEITFQGQS